MGFKALVSGLGFSFQGDDVGPWTHIGIVLKVQVLEGQGRHCLGTWTLTVGYYRGLGFRV